MTKKPLTRITDTWLKSKQEPGGGQEDFKIPGRENLYVRRLPSGTLTWRFRFYPANGGERVVFVFGNYPEISIKTATEMHVTAREEVAKGLDPRLEHKRRLATQAEKQLKELTGQVSIRRVILEWAWHRARRKRMKPMAAVRTLMRDLGGMSRKRPGWIARGWDTRDCRELKKRDAVEVLDKMIKRDSLVAANRLCDLARQVFTVAVERDLLEVNPFLGIHDPGGEEEPRERYLDFDEIKVVWEHLNRPPETNCMSRRLALANMLLLVTCQRTQEVVQARISEFDLERKIWSIPPEHQKTLRKRGGGSKKARKKQAQRKRRVHLVPLSDMACDIVRELISLAGDSTCLLPNRLVHQNPNKPANEKVLYHAIVEEAVRDTDGFVESLWGLDPFHPHDFRRSGATGMTSLGIPREDVSRVLNHVTEGGRKESTTGRVYDKYKYIREKRRALNAWADALCEMVAGRTPTHLLDVQIEKAA